MKRIELIEQRGWLTAATQRAVAAALEIDEGLRKAALAEEIEKTEKRWADTVAREQKQNEAIMAEFQKQMDRGVYKQMKARADKAKRNMTVTMRGWKDWRSSSGAYCEAHGNSSRLSVWRTSVYQALRPFPR